MILGINAVQNPIRYGFFSEAHAVKYSWDGFGDIETLPDRLKKHLSGLPDLVGLFTVLGPGNYTGIRLSLTSIKMLANVFKIPVLGVSLFDAYIGVNPTKELTVLSSSSRRRSGR